MKKQLCNVNARNIFLRIIMIVGILFACITFLSSCLWKQGDTVKAVYKPIPQDVSKQDLEITKTVLKSRLDELGYLSSLVEIENNTSRIIIDKVFWKENDFSASPEEFFEKLGKPFKIIFQEVDEAYNRIENKLISGDRIQEVRVFRRNKQYFISIQLDSEGTKTLAEFSGMRIGKQLGIFVDNQLIITPRISERISDGAVLISGLPKQYASEAAIYIKTGNLPFQLEVVEVE